MTLADMVYDHIYKTSKKSGATELAAKNAAIMGLSDYKKNKFKKLDTMLKTKIKEAVDASK